MKILIIGALLTMSVNAETEKVDAFKYCSGLSKLSEQIMKIRQAGGDIAELYKIADKNEIIEAVIRDAYSQTKWSTEANKQRAIDDFRNDSFLACVKELTES